MRRREAIPGEQQHDDGPPGRSSIVIGAIITVLVAGCAASSLHQPILKNDLAALKEQIAAGADVNETGPGGATPLCRAAALGRMDAMRALLSAGADANPKTCRIPPLVYATRDASIEKVKLLLEHKADPNTRGKDRRRPEDGVPLLVALNMGGNNQEKQRRRAIALQLLAAGARHDVPTSGTGSGPLHLAAARGWHDVVARLLAAGARTRVATKKGDTALHFAVQQRSTGEGADYTRTVAALLAAGAGPWMENRRRELPLDRLDFNTDRMAVANLLFQAMAAASGTTPAAAEPGAGLDCKIMAAAARKFFSRRFLALLVVRKGAADNTKLCMARHPGADHAGLKDELKTYERCTRSHCGRTSSCSGLGTTMSRLAFMAGRRCAR